MNVSVESLARPAVPERLWTYDELVQALPENDASIELWDGRPIMSPTPSYYHQEVLLRFYESLVAHVRKNDLGKAIAAPVDMVLSPHRVVQPDVAFIAKERLDIIQRVIMGPVDLAAEVISLGGRSRDRIEKKDLYEQYGIKEYWIIDPEPETVDLLFLKNNRYELLCRTRRGEIVESKLLPGLTIDVAELFGAGTGKSERVELRRAAGGGRKTEGEEGSKS